jgi:hypothetical protein
VGFAVGASVVGLNVGESEGEYVGLAEEGLHVWVVVGSAVGLTAGGSCGRLYMFNPHIVKKNRSTVRWVDIDTEII